MIDLTLTRDLLEAGVDRLGFDSTGEVIEPGLLSGEGPAVLRVDDVTDAVKLVDKGMVVGPVDRDMLWAVHWFELDRDVLLGLGDTRIEPGDLIEAVEALGHVWQVIPVIPSDP